MDVTLRIANLTLGLYAGLLLGLPKLRADDGFVHVDRGDAGMVVSESAVASRVGRDVLAAGGNAVDAAVATAFALAVTWPEAGNIGGGGFMLVRPADGQIPVCVDYRETAPLSMNATSFGIDDSTLSHKAVGVPGTIRGLALAHQTYGKRSWRDLVTPAVVLAKDGFQVNASLADSINRVLSKSLVQSDPRFSELQRVYGKPDGTRWQAGDRIVQPDLAATLAKIADDPDAFYKGEMADQFVAEMKRGNGQISHEDLRRYRAIIRPAIKGTYNNFTVLGAPPPSSGGTCVIQALNILEQFDLDERDRFDAETIHLIAEVCRRVFADRARYLGDPEFSDAPQHLITKDYAKRVAATIDLHRATPSEQVAPEIAITPESPDTTHFSIVDGDGMAVSNTYTLEASWGSRIVVRGGGYLLNNEMGDFNWFPGVTNRSGRIGTPANLVAPGKRMLSSQTPTMLEKDGQLILVTGSPGGRTIINTVLCIVLNIVAFDMQPAAAVAAPRQHHQWFPDQLYLEQSTRPPYKGKLEVLRYMGHRIVNRSAQGSAHTIAIDPATSILTGIADHRRGGRPAALRNGTHIVWDFAEPAGIQLSNVTSSERTGYRWVGNLQGSTTDGKDSFVIRTKGDESRLRSSVSIGQRETQPRFIDATVKVSGLNLTGKTANERIRFGFASGSEPNAVMIAGVCFRRDLDGRLILESNPSGSDSPRALKVLSPNSSLSGAVVVRLRIDAAADRYQVFYRPANEPAPVSLGSGKIPAELQAKSVRFEIAGDLSDEDEFVAVDRIEIRL